MQTTTQTVTEAFKILMKIHELEKQKATMQNGLDKITNYSKYPIINEFAKITALGLIKKNELETEKLTKELDILIHKIEHP
jgi:predicted phage-related endonuclease